MSSPLCPASVLLIEDDPRPREAISAFLEARGYFTMTADTVEQAIALLGTMRRPCLLLVDPLTIHFDWPRFFASIGDNDQVATLPMVLMSVNAPGLFSKPALVKKPLDLEILFRIVREHCCAGGEGGRGAGGAGGSEVLRQEGTS